jgi:hypothetical protein
MPGSPVTKHQSPVTIFSALHLAATRRKLSANWLMISRFTCALPIAILGATLFASPAPAQIRGMRGFGPVPRSANSFRLRSRGELGRMSHRRFLNGSAFPLPPYDYPYDESDDGTVVNEASPAQVVVVQPAPPAAPAARTVEPLLLENRDGQWVRVPTGSQMAIPQAAKVDSSQASASSKPPGIVELPEVATPLPQLPPAIIVFRDGHREEVNKYMIQGDILYATMNYWSSGSWTRKIFLADVDISASMKVNQERGTKFNLPSAPNEIVVRF